MSDVVQPMNDFVPLHCHSYFSILDGLNSPEQLAARAAELGHSAMAITDHGVCSGLYRFNDACKSIKQCKSCSAFFSGKGNDCPKCHSKDTEKRPSIKPIFGMEGYVVDDVNVREVSEVRRHITLWAKNEVGYKNLIWLSTFGCTSGAYQKPRISLQLLDQHKEGLSVGTACVNGVVCGEYFHGNDAKAEAIMGDLKDMLDGDLYVEFMNHLYDPSMAERQESILVAMKKTLALADRMGVKSIFTYDSHYCRPEDAFCHDVLLSVQTRNTIKNPKRMSFNSSDFYMRSMEDIASRNFGRDDLIINTKEIAEKVSSGLLPHIPFQELLPPFNLPAGFKTEIQYLKMLIRDGMIARGIFNNQVYRDRVTMELGHIEKLGFVRYFLVLWDVVNFAKKSDIPVGPGRGSAAGSLCIYCLGITQLDPIKYDLLFERFINPDRVSPPDVDIDYADDRQNEMFKYASVRYGSEYVARIGTYGTLGAKDAIKRVGKALDIGDDWEDSEMVKSGWKSGYKTLQIVNDMTKSIDEKPGTSLSDIVATNQDIKRYAQQYPKLFETALRMEGTITSPGEHAAGIVLCNRPIVELIPMRHDKDEGFCSQFDKTEVEPLGLLKYDFLGLKNLRIIDKCVKMVKERHGVDIDINSLEPNDPRVFAMLNSGHVHGVFQFEGGDGRMGRDGRPPFHTMSGLLMNIHIDSFEDLIACVALFRPGTLKGIWDGKSVPETYCDYKHGRKPIKLLHPKMGELLGNTYSLMVYQESVMLVSRELALFTLAEADTFRKGIGKKDPVIIESLKQKFIDGCVRNNIEIEVGKKVFELCETFSGYGFNRSHAACYAFIGYQCSWLKCYYKLEFVTSLMSAYIGNELKREKYERAFAKGGIQILPWHLNKSKLDYSIEGNSIRRPLTSLKGVGEKAVEAIVAGQPFSDLKDFMAKINGQVVNKALFKTLVDSGCMDCLGMTKSTLLSVYDRARSDAKDINKERDKQRKRIEDFGALDLFGLPMAGL
jgi:DNA polymerase III subunit alpha